MYVCVCVRVLHFGTSKRCLPHFSVCCVYVRVGTFFVVLESAHAQHTHAHDAAACLWCQNVHTHTRHVVLARTKNAAGTFCVVPKCPQLGITHNVPTASVCVCAAVWHRTKRYPLHLRVCVLQLDIKTEDSYRICVCMCVYVRMSVFVREDVCMCVCVWVCCISSPRKLVPTAFVHA